MSNSELGPSRIIRFHALDTLRFFFATYIVFGHVIGWIGPLRNGGLAVDFFFILSGFVLSHLLFYKEIGFLKFAALRFARIWPLHAASLILVIAVLPRAPDCTEVLVNAALLQNAGILDRLTLNWPSWSISAEMIIGLAILYPIAQFRLRFIAAAISLVSVAILLRQPWSLDHQNVQPFGPISIGLVRCAFGTCLGYLLYETHAALPDTRQKSTLALVLQVLVLLALPVLLYVPMGNFGMAAAILVSGAGVLVFARTNSPVSGFLSHPLVSWVGGLSFGIYMLHAPVIVFLRRHGYIPKARDVVSLIETSDFNLLMPLTAVYVPTIVLAFIAYRFIEMPGKRTIMRWFDVLARGRATQRPSY